MPLGPTDRLYIGWISGKSTDTAEVLLPLTPIEQVALPTPGPRPTEPPDRIGFFNCGQREEDARSFNDAVAAYEDVIRVWQKQTTDAQTREVKGAVAAANSPLSASVFVPDGRGTDIFGALAVAQNVFDSGGPGGRRVVVLFTDLTDTVGVRVRPDLRGAEVIVALYHRDDPIDARRGMDEWRALFSSLGAARSAIIPWAATSAAELRRQIGP